LVAGVVGSKKFAYDIWGDTVNIASRVESAGEAGRVNVSENTFSLIKDRFKCSFRGELPVKNLHPVAMYFVED
jgi:adenylate cyclase